MQLVDHGIYLALAVTLPLEAEPSAEFAGLNKVSGNGFTVVWANQLLLRITEN
jgi:hypothetical protein